MISLSAKSPRKNKLNNTIALVAGGAGFIGAYLVRELINRGIKVIIIDNFATSKEASLTSWVNSPQLRIIDQDLNQPLTTKLGKIDQVWHLVSHEAYLYRDQKATLRGLLTNSLATKQLLDIAVKNRAKFLLASSLEVYRGILSSQNLQYYFGAIPEDTVRFSHAEAKRYAEALTWEYHQERDLDARICRLGEVYGPGMSLKATGYLGKLIEEVQEKNTLTIEGDGLEKEYYTHVYDIATGLIAAMETDSSKGKIFPLTSLDPITNLELTYLIKSLLQNDPEVLFTTIPEKAEIPDFKITGEESLKPLHWRPSITLKKGLARLLKDYYHLPLSPKGKSLAETKTKEALTPPTKKPIPETNSASRNEDKEKTNVPEPTPLNTNQKSKIKTKTDYKKVLVRKVLPLIVIGTVVIGGLLIYPRLAATLYTNRAINHGLRALKSMKEWDTEDTIELGKKMEKTATKLQQTTQKAPAIKKEDKARYQQLASLLFYTGKSFQDAAQIAIPIKQTLASLTGYSQKIETERITQNYESLNRNNSLAKIYWDNYHTSTPNSTFRKEMKDIYSWHTEIEKTAPLLKEIAQSMGSIKGIREEQYWLLLIRDSARITPQGGQIVTIGEATINQGSIVKILVDDWDTAFGEDFKEEYSQPGKTGLIYQAWQEKTGHRPQGIITITTAALPELITLTGPLYIPNYNETLNSDNILEKLVYRTKKTEQSRYKTLITETTQQLLQAILKTPPDEHADLLNIIKTQLQQHSLYLESQSLNNGLGRLQWSGPDTTSYEPNQDILLVLDRDLGTTKASHFIKKTTDYTVRQVSNENQKYLVATLRLTYRHTGQDNTWPGGHYQNQFLVTVPRGSRLLEARMLSSNQARGVITNQIEERNTREVTEWLGNFELSAGQTLQLSMSYQLPMGVNFDQEYRLSVIKPWGTPAKRVSVKINLPEEVGDVKINQSGAEVLRKTVSWQGDVTQNVELLVKQSVGK